jgi:glycerol-1-phosphate dehydrogenase [NAD(P)+]
MIDDITGDVIYAVGGGLAVDAGKYLSVKTCLPLVCIPTVLSVDAFFTWASGVRRNGCVVYLDTRPPDRVIIDFDVLAAGPPSIRAAGICDVLSIATGCWDWQYAETKGKNPPAMGYVPHVADTARSIMQGAIDVAEAAGRGDREGLKGVLDALMMEVQLTNQIGHARPEEGSEHYFAYAVENEMGHGLPHGDLVGPGIVLAAALQGQDVTPLTRALQACRIPLSSIPAQVIEETVAILPEYSKRHNLPYGIAHEVTVTDLMKIDIERLLG